MRMWMANPKLMCDKHLNGEHVELHMFVGSINKGTSMTGYIENNMLEVISLHARHEQIADEMLRRGFNHKSPLPLVDQRELDPDEIASVIDREAAVAELVRRCPACAERIQKAEVAICDPLPVQN